MNAIILAAGHSSRMIEEKQYTHKPLLPILGLPNIERTILILNDFGINDIVIIAGIYADQYTFLQEKLCTRLHIVVKSSIISSIKEGAKKEELHE